MHFAVAVAEVYVDRLAFELLDLRRTRVGQDKMADVNIGFDPRMSAFVHETHHCRRAVQQAEAKRFQFQGDIDFLLAGVISKAAASLEAPLPLSGRCNNFALPNILAQHQQDVSCIPGVGKVNELLAAFDMKLTNGFVEVNQSESDHWQ